MPYQIIWSTTLHEQASYQIWKLSDQRPQSYELCSQSTTIYWKCMKTQMQRKVLYSYKNCRIKMAGKYDQRPIIPPNTKATRPQALHPQSDAGQTNKRTNQKLYSPILSYAGHEKPQIWNLIFLGVPMVDICYQFSLY